MIHGMGLTLPSCMHVIHLVKSSARAFLEPITVISREWNSGLLYETSSLVCPTKTRRPPWLTYWNEHEFRMHTRRHGQHGRFFNRHGRDAAEDKPAGGGRVPPGGDSGGGGGGGGGGGDGDGGSGGYRPGAPPDRDPFGPDSDWNRFLAEEDEAERESGDKNRELTFIESIFAFVFGEFIFLFSCGRLD